MNLVKNKSRATKGSKKWDHNFSRREGRAVINEHLAPPVEISIRPRPVYIYGDEH